MPAQRIFFVTNRNHQPDNKELVFGKHFNPDGAAALRFGHADFSGRAEAPTMDRIMVYDDIKTKDPKDAKKGGSADFLSDLQAAMLGEGRDTMVYIHGFNVDFKGALAAGARLGMNLGAHGRPTNIVVFTWPSDGEAVPFMSYYSDREDARVSGPAVARAFLKLRDFVLALDPDTYCDQSLHLLCHSMGNYVLRNGLQALCAKDEKSLVRLFDQIILAAPDEDDDTFETREKLALLPRIGRQVTVYFNPHDKALLISDKTKGNPDRLGSDGPRLIDLIPKKIVLVDCRNVQSVGDKLIDHSYYLNSEAVRADIAGLLITPPLETMPNREYVTPKRYFRIKADPPPPAT